MNKKDIAQRIGVFVRDSTDNSIAADKAITPEVIGLRMFESPLVFVGAADDAMFGQFAAKGGIGKSFQGPCIFSIVLSSENNQYTVGNCNCGGLCFTDFVCF